MKTKLIIAILFGVFVLALLNSSYASTCGNNICESDEDSCKCSADCKGCSGPVEGEICKSYGCIGKGCTIITTPNCCPNKLCEITDDYKENYGNCPGDCKPESVDINVVSPSADATFLRGQIVPIILDISASGKGVAGAKVKITGLPKRMEAFNDGRHDDGTNFDSIYGASLTVPTGAEGEIVLDANAEFRKIYGVKSIIVKVVPIMQGTIDSPDKINLGDELRVKGHINKLPDDKQVRLKMRLESGSEAINVVEGSSETNGDFALSYKTAYENPLGEWKVTVEGIDDYNNTFSASDTFAVEKRTNEGSLKIEFAKVIEKDYRRGDKIEFGVKVLDENDKIVEGAEVSLIGQAKDIVKLSESPKGTYRGFYFLQYDLDKGQYNIEIFAKKVGEKAIYEGKKDAPVNVSEAQLGIEEIEPNGKEFVPGESVLIKVKGKYPAGEIVETASVKGSSDSKLYNFREDTRGIYVTNYILPETAESKKFTVTLEDQYGNKGTKEILVKLKGAGAGFDIQKFGIIAVVLIVLAIAAVLVYFAKMKRESEGMPQKKEPKEPGQQPAENEIAEESIEPIQEFEEGIDLEDDDTGVIAIAKEDDEQR